MVSNSGRSSDILDIASNVSHDLQGICIPRHPKSKFLVRIGVKGTLKSRTSGDVRGFKHLLTRYLDVSAVHGIFT